MTMAINETLTNDQARQTLDRILASPEFTATGVLEKIQAYINHCLEHVRLPAGSGTAMVYAEEVLIVLTGVMVLSYLIWKTLPVWKVMVGEARSTEISKSVAIQPTAASLLTEADKKASNGDFRLALRDIYLSLLLEMEHRRLISYAVAKTNSEYLREISEKTVDLKERFQSMVTLFEDKWYGLQACAGEDFQKGRELYMVLLKENPHG